VRYWITPWNTMAPGMARNYVVTSILEHLTQAGLYPAYPKQDIFYAELPERVLDSKSVEDRTQLLGRIEMFEHLETGELRELATNMALRSFSNGQHLIEQGAAGESMFILSEGLLHAFINTNGSEEQLRVGEINPGQFFGEMSLLTGEPRSASIVAATDVVVHEITKDHITKLLSKRPEIADSISKVVAHRRVLNSQAMANATVEERIQETESMARQIMTKMKAFFKGVFDR